MILVKLKKVIKKILGENFINLLIKFGNLAIHKPKFFLQWISLRGSRRYAFFQREFYDGYAKKADYETDIKKESIVGSYEEHNHWKDYDIYIFKYIDDSYLNKKALDFGCGPGRNIIKYHAKFKRIDGIDISPTNIENAYKNLAYHHISKDKFQLYVNDGFTLKPLKSSFYDFTFSTICFQHICVYKTRFNLLSEMFRVLKSGGRLAIQMGYGKDSKDTVGYYDNNYSALDTNRGCDTRIEESNQVKKDLEQIGFTRFEYDIRSTGPGDYHPKWIFFRAKKT